MKSLAVIPFSHEGKLNFVASGLSSYLIRELGLSGHFKIISESSSSQIKEASSLFKIGKQLKCDYIISGKLIEDDQFIVLLKIHDIPQQKIIWESRVEATKDNVIELGSLCYHRLIYRLTSRAELPVNNFSKLKRPINNTAYLKFLEGIHYFNRWNEENSLDAEKLFLEVIDLEPEFVPAYNWLSKVYIFQAGRGFAIS